MKGQSTIELPVLVLWGILIFISASAMAYRSYLDLEQIKTASTGRSLCRLIASEINTAATMGDGFQRSFSWPNSIAVRFSDYAITLDNSERRAHVEWSGGGCSEPLRINATGTLRPDKNFLKVSNGSAGFN